ncbi:hypothetical protein GH714_041314 [Hevea brasiliensis]|uniref:Methyltransferase FkbM domain-containing protein n=1 Tax=Hevea brasiliensis TaxID=3981 RepID=A0A6A6N1I1_HEVBR|nr:hypothetical protein GH714_041314 [Hevea brasiliensis]
MASFAAAVMGYRVLAFEPVIENLQRICDGIWFNRVGDLVTVFEAAVSDRIGNITFYKLVGRLDNSAVSATGAKLAFKSNEEIAVQVRTIPLDDLIPESEPVLLLKIDVQDGNIMSSSWDSAAGKVLRVNKVFQTFKYSKFQSLEVKATDSGKSTKPNSLVCPDCDGNGCTLPSRTSIFTYFLQIQL